MKDNNIPMWITIIIMLVIMCAQVAFSVINNAATNRIDINTEDIKQLENEDEIIKIQNATIIKELEFIKQTILEIKGKLNEID